MDYLDIYLAKLPEFEGHENHLYRDSAEAGNATTGEGLMLPSVDESIKLGWMAGERPATSDEIRADWNRVMALPAGKKASYYRTDSSLLLLDSEIAMRAKIAVDAVDAELIQAFKDFYTYPPSAKLAMMDMGYSLGVPGLLHKFPEMVLAIFAKNWIGAAMQSKRPQLSVQRNLWVKNLFEAAAKGL